MDWIWAMREKQESTVVNTVIGLILNCIFFSRMTLVRKDLEETYMKHLHKLAMKQKLLGMTQWQKSYRKAGKI